MNFILKKQNIFLKIVSNLTKNTKELIEDKIIECTSKIKGLENKLQMVVNYLLKEKNLKKQ